jgi:hypothetical protein
VGRCGAPQSPGNPKLAQTTHSGPTGYRQIGCHPKVNLSPKGVCNVVNRQLAEAGPRQLSQQVVRHPPPVLSELGCPALRGMPHRTEQADGGGVDGGGARPQWFAAFLASG